jgi:hypothetical protein
MFIFYIQYMGRRNENVSLPAEMAPPENFNYPTVGWQLTLQIPWQGSLRDRVEQVEEYVIPHGDWFEIVSSPHYLAEIITLSISLSLSPMYVYVGTRLFVCYYEVEDHPIIVN